MQVNPLFDAFSKELQSFVSIESYLADILEIDWLFPPQVDVLREFYEVDAFGNPLYNELIAVAGMRSGKTIIGSIISTYEGFKLINLGKPCAFYGLPRGQDIFILNVATSERQAKDTVFSQVKARIDNSDWWQDQPVKEHHNEFIYTTGDCKVIFRSEHSNSASLAGKTNKCCVLDETARFKDTGGKLSGQMVYDTVSRGVRTFGTHGKLVSISSPIYVDDFQMRLYRRAIEKDMNGNRVNPLMLGIHKATWELNLQEQYTREALEPEFRKDPEAAWRDWGAQPSASIEAYIKEPWRVDVVMKKDRYNVATLIEDVLKGDVDESEIAVHVKPGTYYYMAGDPAFKNDAFGFAMLHMMDKTAVYDIVHRFAPDTILNEREIDAENVKKFALLVAKYFPVFGMITDTWQYPETVCALKKKGVNVIQHFVDKETYDMFKEAVYMGMVLMPFYPVFKDEFISLELRRGTKIDHPRGKSKDVSDACANAYYFATSNMIDLDEPLWA